MKSMVLFNNKGGVGKTTLTFNIAHMMARRGMRVAVLDYDPQCNISSIFLSEEQLEEIWESGEPDGRTVAGCIEPVRRGKGEVIDPKLIAVATDPKLVAVADNLWLLPGHLSLSRFEQTLAEEWPKTFAQDNERALDVTTALDELSNRCAQAADADVVLFDMGPSLGALNRSALLACDAVVIPVAPDLFSLQGLRNVGPTLRDWREDWQVVCERHLKERAQESTPRHQFQPIGYIVQQHLARVDRPVAGYAKWAQRIPAEYHTSVLGQPQSSAPPSIESDGECIGTIKHFASLVPLAQMARKPIFDLKQADGIGGGQFQAVAKCRIEFEQLVNEINRRLAAMPCCPS